MLLVGPTLLGLAAGLFFRVLGSHVAQSSFAPQSSGGGLGALAGLAAQFGGRLPGGLGGDATESLDFYAGLVRSPEILAKVAEKEYSFQRSEDDTTKTRGNLYKYYGIRGETESERRRKMVEKLQGRVSAGVNRLGNTVSIRVKAPYPELAQQVNRALLERVNDFNLQQRQSAAGAQRRFVELRVQAAQRELMFTEDSMRVFLERNRAYESDPRLVMEQARLQRRIDLRQTVYTTLAQSFEEARIEEIRNTPVITIIDPPELYTKRSRNPIVMGVLAFLAALGVAGAFALAREAVESERHLTA